MSAASALMKLNVAQAAQTIDFAEIGDGERPPRYLFSVERDSLGKRSVTFSRMAPAEPVVSKPIRNPRTG